MWILSVLKSAVVLAIACAIVGAEIAPLWGSPLVSLAVSAGIWSISVTVIVLAMLFVLAIVGAFVGAISGNAGVGAGCGILLALLFIVPIEVAVLYSMPAYVSFFPRIDLTGCIGVSLVDTMLGLLFQKRDDKK